MPQLRPISAQDSVGLEQVAAVFRETRHSAALPWLAPDQDLDYFTQVVATGQQLWGAFYGERLLGFIAFDKGWIHHLYILPSMQRQGVGSRLLDKAFEIPGPKKLHLFEDNAEASKFYAARGFLPLSWGEGQGRVDVLHGWGQPRAVAAK